MGIPPTIMCTVTFIPDGRGAYHLTSNRDEHVGRARALPPRRHDDISYPRDAAAGGSWVALKRNGDAGVLLNGAFVKHQRGNMYRRSRGLIFLDIIHASCPPGHFSQMELEGIEAFTMILFINKALIECRWDGNLKWVRELETTRPHIWSSVTLYDEATQARREDMLTKWYCPEDVSTESILDFHRHARMEGKVSTVSITTLRVGRGKARIKYIDLKETPAPRKSAFLIRLMHWEYWPFFIVYAPMFLYWAWLSLKAKSLFFFSTANPTITHSGFLLESKKQIYDLLPAGVYPRTLFFRKGARMGDIRHRLAESGLQYPLMAKPDIGQRGMGVELVKDECGLLFYAMRSRVDYLLQEYIDYPMEAGVFYCRMPGHAKGTITGVVAKEFLSVTGDGYSTVETLLRRHERYILQLPGLRRVLGRGLQRVPAKGERLELAPYGNHSRGAQFLDHSHRITPRLEAVIDDLCRRTPGFHFGRLDIRFQSWSQLEAGEAFSVIELNGAGSEPTHIYDPGHTLFFAWKEIVRHLDILYKISRANAARQKLVPMSFREGVRMLLAYRRHEKLITA
jgi:hypothetical protein